MSDQYLRTIAIVGRPDLGAPDWRNNVRGPADDRRGDFGRGRVAGITEKYGKEHRKMTPDTQPTRRGMLMKLGFCEWPGGGRSGSPGGSLSPFLGHARGGYDAWVSIGRASQFPEGQTRLATFRNPYGVAADGETDDTACWVRHVAANNSRCSPSTARTWDVRCAGSRNRALFMCPCHGGVYYQRRVARFRSAGTRPVRISPQN